MFCVYTMRRRRKGQLLLFIVITLLICATYFVAHLGKYEPSGVGFGPNGIQKHTPRRSFSSKCMPYRKHLQHYCHSSLLEPRNVEFTQEGKFSYGHPEFDSVDLVHAHVIIRHGDRTPAVVHPKFGHPKPEFKCGVSGIVHRSEAWGAHTPNLWEGLHDFPPLSPAGDSDGVKHGDLKLHPGSANQSCGIGDLTSQGFLQLHNLGTLLQMSYGQLFPGMDLTTDIHVQSSDYRRTIRSAGAFLLGFIPSVPQLREMIKIHVQPGSVNQAPPEGIPLAYKSCRALWKLRETENNRRNYHAKEEEEFGWLYEKFLRFFNLTVHPGTPWTDIFDKFTTRGCHSLETDSILPCRADGACVDCKLGKQMFDYADWAMSRMYPPNSSLIAATPFLKHSLLEPIERIITGDQPSLRYRIMLTFTHDSTLNQLLRSLGLPLKGWMPYASRLSFELWKTMYFLEETPQYFLRVLFNGRIVTHELPFSDSNVSEIVEFTKFKNTVVPADLWEYNRQCGI